HPGHRHGPAEPPGQAGDLDVHDSPPGNGLNASRHVRRKQYGSRLPGRAGPGHRTTEPNQRSYHAGSGRRPGAALIPRYDNADVMSPATLAAYPWIVKRMPGIPSAASRAQAAARRAWRGLVQVLIGPDPPSAWRWRSPEERGAAYAVLAIATVALCAA